MTTLITQFSKSWRWVILINLVWITWSLIYLLVWFPAERSLGMFLKGFFAIPLLTVIILGAYLAIERMNLWYRGENDEN